VTVNQSGLERQISFVVKTSAQQSFQKRVSSLLRPFAKEIFWYNKAHPILTKLYPGNLTQ
jgi:hypothetical protein